MSIYDQILLAPYISKLTVDSFSTMDTTPELTGTVSDPVAAVTVTIDGNPYAATNNGDGTWTLADDTITPALSLGSYTILAEATIDGQDLDAYGAVIVFGVSSNRYIDADADPYLTASMDNYLHGS